MSELPSIDRIGLLVILLPASALLGAHVYVLWRARALKPHRQALGVRLASVAVFSLLAIGWIRHTAHALQVAQWSCAVCGKEEMRLSWLGCPLLGLRSHLPGFEGALRFHDWFQKEIGATHEHDWIVDHERSVGSQVSCESSIGGRPFHRGLPILPDEVIARDLAGRLLETPPEQRYELWRDFDIDVTVRNPIRLVASEGPMPLKEFRERYAAWLREHPLWQ